MSQTTSTEDCKKVQCESKEQCAKEQCAKEQCTKEQCEKECAEQKAQCPGCGSCGSQCTCPKQCPRCGPQCTKECAEQCAKAKEQCEKECAKEQCTKEQCEKECAEQCAKAKAQCPGCGSCGSQCTCPKQCPRCGPQCTKECAEQCAKAKEQCEKECTEKAQCPGCGSCESQCTCPKAGRGACRKTKCSKAAIDPVANYPYLTDKHKSLMVQALRANPDLYARYCNVRTSLGYTFDQAIQAGLDATHLLVGVVAGDEECYTLYRDMMDFVVEKWHGYKSSDQHRTDLDPGHLVMTPEQEAKFDYHIVSTRVRSGRNIKGLPLPPGATRQSRREVERIVSTAVGQFTGFLQGTYFPLSGMTEQEEKQLIDDHFLFQKPSPRQVLAVCGAARDWPDSRGIFFNEARTFLIWVNEEDQMRIIAMQQGGNVKDVFARWVAGVNSIQESLRNNGNEFMYDDHFGFLSTCPSNLGTGLRASVMLKVPKLYKAHGVHGFEDLCSSMGLQARGEKGEHSPPGPNGEFDVSNKARLGFTEVELVQQLINGVDRLIAMEEALPDN